MAERGRKGGEALRNKLAGGLPLGPLETARDCRRWLAVIGRAAVKGQIRPQAAGIGIRACEGWLRAEEARVQEEELAELRDQLAEIEARLDGRGIGVVK